MLVMVRVMADASDTATFGLVAVKGPRLPGVDGTSNCRPPEATGEGKVRLNGSAPVDMVDGVAPTADTVAVAVPVRAKPPMGGNSFNTLGGNVACAWKFCTVNCWPTLGAAGESDPVITTSLMATLPRGVLAQ